MFKNKYLVCSLMVVICIGNLLFGTSCSKHIGRYTMGGCGDHRFTQHAMEENRNLDNLFKLKIVTGDIKECELARVDWSKVDLSTFNLCKVNSNKKTLLCKALEIGALDLLEKCLKEIESNPIKYPPEKVIALMVGYRSPIKGMKIPLLMRAVSKSYHEHLNMFDKRKYQRILQDILELLFGTLAHYSLGACEQAFSVRFGRGKYTIMHQVVDMSNLQMVKYLINKYIEIKKQQGITHASALTSLEQVLSIGNSISNTPLDLALMTFYFRCRHILTSDLGSCDAHTLEILDIFCYLVEYGNPSSQIKKGSKSVFHSIVKSGDSAMFKIIMEIIINRCKKISNCDYKKTIDDILNISDEDGESLLYYATLSEAARGTTPHMVEYLMSLGASATHSGKSGIYPLLIAIAFADFNIVQLLLDKKFPGNPVASHINKQGPAGLTPVNWATCPREKLTVSTILRAFKKLIKSNPDINPCSSIGKVSLDIVQLLLDHGADPSIPDMFGNSPIHRALKKGEINLLEPLWKAGASPLAQDSKGNNALLLLLKQVPVRAKLIGYNGLIMRKYAEVIYNVLIRLKPIDVAPYKGDIINLYMDILNTLKNPEVKSRRHQLKIFVENLLTTYGISNTTTSDYKKEKRPFDFENQPIDSNKKRKRNSVQECDRSSGKTQGTYDCLLRPWLHLKEFV